MALPFACALLPKVSPRPQIYLFSLAFRYEQRVRSGETRARTDDAITFEHVLSGQSHLSAARQIYRVPARFRYHAFYARAQRMNADYVQKL